MFDWLTFWIIFAAVMGAIGTAVLGWLESKEPFAPRKFWPSILRAVAAGVSVGIVYLATGEPITTLGIGMAFVAGGGVDAGLKRLSGTLGGTVKT